MQMIDHTTSAWPKQIHKFTNRQLHKIERADSWNHREFVWLILKFQYLHTGDEIIEDWWGEGSDMVMAVMLGCRHFWLTLSQDYPHAMVNIHSILCTTCTHLFKPIHLIFTFHPDSRHQFHISIHNGWPLPSFDPAVLHPSRELLSPLSWGEIRQSSWTTLNKTWFWIKCHNSKPKTWLGEKQNVRSGHWPLVKPYITLEAIADKVWYRFCQLLLNINEIGSPGLICQQTLIWGMKRLTYAISR